MVVDSIAIGAGQQQPALGEPDEGVGSSQALGELNAVLELLLSICNRLGQGRGEPVEGVQDGGGRGQDC